MKKKKMKVWDGLPVMEFTFEVKFNDGDSAGQTKKFKFIGHVGNWFEKLSWLVANDNMSIPNYEILSRHESEPLTEE